MDECATIVNSRSAGGSTRGTCVSPGAACSEVHGRRAFSCRGERRAAVLSEPGGRATCEIMGRMLGSLCSTPRAVGTGFGSGRP